MDMSGLCLHAFLIAQCPWMGNREYTRIYPNLQRTQLPRMLVDLCNVINEFKYLLCLVKGHTRHFELAHSPSTSQIMVIFIDLS